MLHFFRFRGTAALRRYILQSPRGRGLSVGPFRSQQSVQVAVSEDGRKLKLQCEGEQERRFHSIWLRHNCRCPVCTSVHTNQTIVNPNCLTKDLRVDSATFEGQLDGLANK